MRGSQDPSLVLTYSDAGPSPSLQDLPVALQKLLDYGEWGAGCRSMLGFGPLGINLYIVLALMDLAREAGGEPIEIRLLAVEALTQLDGGRLGDEVLSTLEKLAQDDPAPKMRSAAESAVRLAGH